MFRRGLQTLRKRFGWLSRIFTAGLVSRTDQGRTVGEIVRRKTLSFD